MIKKLFLIFWEIVPKTESDTEYTEYIAIIQSTFYRLIKGQQYLKKMFEINCDD